MRSARSVNFGTNFFPLFNQWMEEMYTKAHLKQVVSSEDELTSSTDNSLNIQGPLVLELLDAGRRGIEIPIL